jgi:glycyl-tRNA synthetase beta chain
MTDFLLELRSEEIPARMQVKAKEDFARLFNDALAKAGLSAASVETFATPRRLALIATGLPLATEAVSEETKGPKVGAPPQAMEGFLRKTGLSQDQLVERDGVYFAVVQKAGRQTTDVLAEAIPAIIRAFPWPKSQRWGAASVSTESLRWVRPLQGIIALLGDDVVHCEIDGIVSGAATMGHRFHHSGQITIGNAGDYIEKLRACHVIVHLSERCRIIRDGAKAAASAAGLTLVEDEGLVIENAGLTEWPVPMLGRFDPAFLEVPQEVIQLTARVNQKYFVCTSPIPQARGGPDSDAGMPSPNTSRKREGELANAFVCTANIDAHDGGAAIVAGNEKVLAARLSDAKFFWEQDLKVSLDDQAQKLSQITFHEKLGTVADKVDRVAKLARWLVEEGIVKSSPSTCDGEGDRAAGVVEGQDPFNAPPSSEAAASAATSPSQVDGEDLAAQAERAARLCKADLVTGMVGEFPELQGIMGGYYARAQGESDAVADAVRDHYKPVGQGDDIPTAPVTVAVSLADKLDTISGFFHRSVQMQPTGSKDPFALRRAALGAISLVEKNGLRLPLHKFLAVAEPLVFKSVKTAEVSVKNSANAGVSADQTFATTGGPALLELQLSVSDFFADRLKVQQREAGVRHDLIDAVFSLGSEDDLVRLLARVKALQAYITTAEGANLLAAYKRAANILKGSHPVSPVLDKASDAPMSDAAEQQMPQTGEEDPFVDVDQGMRSAIAGNHGRTEGIIPEGAAAADIALLGALDIAEPQAQKVLEAEQFEDAMAALATLREPIDRFFDEVMVNDEDPAKRAFRLGLLARFRDAVTKVADFSKIEG